MFTTTDEKMRQIEQPMECFLERNNRKYKRCKRFFSDEASLKQHHCELPIKKEKCSHCTKTINPANNLDKHLRSCEKAFTHPAKRQLHQTTQDKSTSSENRPSTPKKLMVEKVQVGGAPAEYVEHWKAPWNSRVSLKLHSSHIEYQQQQRRPATIERGYPEHETCHPGTKSSYRGSCQVVSITKHELLQVHSPGAKIDPGFMFHSEVFKSIDNHELYYHFQVGYNQVVLQIDEFQCNRSGWVVDHLHHLDLGTCFF